jgi:LysR family nod box-dependent transcriptional activator
MTLHRLDLNRLVALDALLDEASVSRAAERLHVSQPAMSATLAALREHFDDPLLVSLGRTMRLTGFAQGLRDPVRELLLQAQALAQRRPARTVATLERSVTLVASDMTVAVLLAPLAERATHEAPGLQFRIRPVGLHLSDELDRGEVDIVIAARQGLSDRHPRRTFFSTPFACLLWREHEAQVLDLPTYLALPHVTTHWSLHGFTTMEDQALRDQRLTRRIEVEVPAFTLMPPFLIGTRRVATLPQPLAVQLTQQLPLKVLPCPLPVTAVQGAVQWHRHQDEDPAIRWVVQTLVSLAEDLAIAAT